MFLTDLPILAIVWPLKFEYMRGWHAALLFLALAIPIVLLGIRSLAGLGPVRRWVAVGARLLVLLLFILIIAGARWQRENKILEVMVLRDISESTNLVRDFPGKSLSASIEDYLRGASDTKVKPPEDLVGVISFQESSLIDAVPSERLTLDARALRPPGRGTDVASAIQLALATLRRDAMHRMLLIWDGNQTTGDLETALNAAAAQRVPIDVMPLRYDVQSEVLVDRFIAPTWKRENEPFTIEVILRSTNATPTVGRLTVTDNDRPLDLDPTTDGVQTTRLVTLQPGRNVERITIPPLPSGVHMFHATFEGENVTVEQPAGATGAGTASANANRTRGAAAAIAGDTLLQNNAADAFTFVRGKGKVLYIDNVAEGRGQILRDALTSEGIALDEERTGIDQFPRSLVELQNYDAVVLANVPRGAGGLDEEQQKMLATYVHDMGGGLVMIGGPDAYGAGGWGGSDLEKVLPVDMDIPAQRQLPKGALVLVMHSCEMPDGNYWGEQCAIKAVETLSPRDEIGVISYDWGRGGSQWDYPLAARGDGSKVISAIKNMKLGDMPSFDDSMNVALHGSGGVGGLIKSDARQKHVIIISDGDPQRPNDALVKQYNDAKVSVSTVAVYPHDTSDQGLPPTMREIARLLKGRAYGPINNNFTQLPQIFIKEATVVRRSLIHEDSKGIALKLPPSSSDMIKGVSEFPSVYGLVLTSKKNNPQIEVPIVAGAHNDPVLAHWQTGLGRAAAFTSDAHNKWAANWVGSAMYGKFWAQVVRTVARPPLSAEFDVQTIQTNDGKGKIVVEALTKDSAFLNFLSIAGSVVGPDGKPKAVRLVQTGPGTYQGEFEANDPGNYVAMLNYQGGAGKSGAMLTGMAVNASPELRELKSNDAALRQVAQRTGGRVLSPWDATVANLFSREGLVRTASPLPIWDILIPILLATIIFDVAVRRIAWDWAATKKLAFATAERVRGFTVIRKVESRETLDALKRVREEVAETKFRTDEEVPVITTDAPARPDPTAKFQARGVEGDITKLVGGASDKPIPPPPKKIEPKGAPAGAGGHTSSLLEAKRRAQQKIKEREKDE
jgi:uncharacterized membrane protein